jgi:hypothetical protein
MFPDRVVRTESTREQAAAARLTEIRGPYHFDWTIRRLQKN